MAALELRANQQNSSKIYSSVFGMEDLSQGASRIGNFQGGTTPVKGKKPKLRSTIKKQSSLPIDLNSHLRNLLRMSFEMSQVSTQ